MAKDLAEDFKHLQAEKGGEKVHLPKNKIKFV